MRRFAVVLLCVLALPASARAWTWPVDGPVLRPFAFDPAHPYAGGQHRGIDIGAAEGTLVHAPADGTVTFAGSVPGGGKTIAIETPFGYSATLLHLGSIAVARGAPVTEGAIVGTTGAESFVYFGLRVAGNSQGYVDPLLFLPAPVEQTSSAAVEPVPASVAPPSDVAPAAEQAVSEQPAPPAAATEPAPTSVTAETATPSEPAAAAAEPARVPETPSTSVEAEATSSAASAAPAAVPVPAPVSVSETTGAASPSEAAGCWTRSIRWIAGPTRFA